MKARRNGSSVTLADVAERAGVSVTTVSVILGARRNQVEQFHPDTIEKVLRAADRLGYRRNLFASGLPGKESPFFAVVIRDIGKAGVTAWHHWAFEGDLLTGAIQVAADANMYPVVAAADPLMDETELRPIERLIAGGVFGTIVRSPSSLLEECLSAQMKRGQRIAIVFPDSPSKWISNAITVDNAAIGRIAGTLLARQGRRRWAVVHYRDRPPRESHWVRRQAFTDLARRNGVAVRVVGLPREPEAFTEEDLAQLRDDNLDGIFAVDSVLSVDALLACLRIGRKPPEDVSLVGCNCSRWPSAGLPRISSVEVSWKAAGVAAMKALLRMADKRQSHFPTVLMKPRVVPGETCAVPRDLVSRLAEA